MKTAHSWQRLRRVFRKPDFLGLPVPPALGCNFLLWSKKLPDATIPVHVPTSFKLSPRRPTSRITSSSGHYLVTWPLHAASETGTLWLPVCPAGVGSSLGKEARMGTGLTHQVPQYMSGGESYPLLCLQVSFYFFSNYISEDIHQYDHASVAHLSSILLLLIFLISSLIIVATWRSYLRHTGGGLLQNGLH